MFIKSGVSDGEVENYCKDGKNSESGKKKGNMSKYRKGR